MRIAPDGRSEVRVATGSQAKMAQVLWRIAGLLERAQHKIGQNAFFGLSRDLFNEFLIIPRRDLDVQGLQHHITMGNGALGMGSSPRAVFQTRKSGNASFRKSTAQSVSEA